MNKLVWPSPAGEGLNSRNMSSHATVELLFLTSLLLPPISPSSTFVTAHLHPLPDNIPTPISPLLSPPLSLPLSPPLSHPLSPPFDVPFVHFYAIRDKGRSSDGISSNGNDKVRVPSCWEKIAPRLTRWVLFQRWCYST